MRKPTKAASPEMRTALPDVEAAREHRTAIAYRAYSRNALLRFDLQGQIETIRQQRAELSLTEVVVDQTVAEHVRSILRHERTH